MQKSFRRKAIWWNSELASSLRKEALRAWRKVIERKQEDREAWPSLFQKSCQKSKLSAIHAGA